MTSGDLFGTRAYLSNNYLYRLAAVVLGIYGNSKEEEMYPVLRAAPAGQLNGGNRYTVRFAPGQLPPVNAYWPMTMYDLPNSLLVANPINRYLLNSPMLRQFVKDADGGVTFYVQNESPGKEREPNWLPAPKGSSQFTCVSTGRRPRPWKASGPRRLCEWSGRNRRQQAMQPGVQQCASFM